MWRKQSGDDRGRAPCRSRSSLGRSEAPRPETGITKPDVKQVRNLIGAVNRSLLRHVGGSVQRVGQGMPARWKVQDDGAAPSTMQLFSAARVASATIGGRCAIV